VPALVEVKVRVPVKSAVAIRMVRASRCGRSKAVYSISMGWGRYPARTVAVNRVPTPMGPSVTFSDVSMFGL
jgi:hypothetical protein